MNKFLYVVIATIFLSNASIAQPHEGAWDVQFHEYCANMDVWQNADKPPLNMLWPRKRSISGKFWDVESGHYRHDLRPVDLPLLLPDFEKRDDPIYPALLEYNAHVERINSVVNEYRWPRRPDARYDFVTRVMEDYAVSKGQPITDTEIVVGVDLVCIVGSPSDAGRQGEQRCVDAINDIFGAFSGTYLRLKCSGVFEPYRITIGAGHIIASNSYDQEWAALKQILASSFALSDEVLEENRNQIVAGEYNMLWGKHNGVRTLSVSPTSFDEAARRRDRGHVYAVLNSAEQVIRSLGQDIDMLLDEYLVNAVLPARNWD